MTQEEKTQIEERIVDVLKTVYDPEIPVNIYDLGMIYKIDVQEDLSVSKKDLDDDPNAVVSQRDLDDGPNAVVSQRDLDDGPNAIISQRDLDDGPNAIVELDMTFTAPNCPAADYILEDVRTKVESVEGVKSTNVNLVFEPAWDQSMMSEEARVELGFD